MLLAILLVPALAGVLAFFLRSDQLRRALLVLASATHLGLTVASWLLPVEPLLDGWIQLDSLGRLFLATTSLLFLAASIQSVMYLGAERRQGQRKAVKLDSAFDKGPGHPLATHGESGAVVKDSFEFFAKVPEAIFTACMLLLLAALSLVTLCQHLGLVWVAVEATTLTSAPLVYFHRDGRSLEATWKYLVVCSVGIALALLGNFFLAVAASQQANGTPTLVVSQLVAAAPQLHPSWLKAAMIFLVVGYGTKMGLAPLHTWLPDAHSEAPAVVSAVLSGAVLNTAFLAILRSVQVCDAAGLGAFARELLVILGLVSMATAAVFVIGQSDYKRMLAYSSVEHMGVLAVGIGVGGAGSVGALMHAVNHSVAKGLLFLVAGQILAVYATKRSAHVRGMLRGYPLIGFLWLAGFLAVSGVPPFGTFVSELAIAKAAIDQHRPVVLVLYLLLLGIVFIGMASAVLPMAQGRSDAEADTPPVSLKQLAPAAALGVIAVVMGLHVPSFVGRVIQSAAASLGGY